MKTVLKIIGAIFILMCVAWVPNANAKKSKNPFLPTRAHIPKGQQLGVYFLPWDDNVKPNYTLSYKVRKLICFACKNV